jgi:hypothetical protein
LDAPQAEAVPDLLAQLYDEADVPLRAKLLLCLLRPLGPLGLVGIAAGAFGVFLRREAWQQLSEPIAGGIRFSADQVRELATLVVQIQPEAFLQLPAILADHPFGVQSVSASLLAFAVRRLVRDHRPEEGVP